MNSGLSCVDTSLTLMEVSVTDISRIFLKKTSISTYFDVLKDIEKKPSSIKQEIFRKIITRTDAFQSIGESKSFILALLCYNDDRTINTDRVRTVLRAFDRRDVPEHIIATFIEQVIDYNPLNSEIIKDIVCNTLSCNSAIASVLTEKCDIDEKLLNWLNCIPNIGKVALTLITRYPHLLEEKARLARKLDPDDIEEYLSKKPQKEELRAFVDLIAMAVKKKIYVPLRSTVLLICRYVPELLNYMRDRYSNIFFDAFDKEGTIEQFLFVKEVNPDIVRRFVFSIKKAKLLDESNYYILKYIDQRFITESFHDLSTSVSGIFFLSTPSVKKFDAKILARLIKTGLKSRVMEFNIVADTEMSSGIIGCLSNNDIIRLYNGYYSSSTLFIPLHPDDIRELKNRVSGLSLVKPEMACFLKKLEYIE